MSDVNAEYQAAYDKAAADLEAAANATTAPPEPAAKVDEVVTEAAKPVDPAPAPEKSELDQIKERLATAEKMARDNQAWATKAAQEAAQLRREREQQQRAASKPAILDENPELADAIRYVAADPAPAYREEDRRNDFQTIVSAAHPGIFDASIDPELEKGLIARLDALGDEKHDPLVFIREVTAEKLVHAERQIGARFAAESARQAQKSAMSVPGAGGGAARAPANPDLEEVQRIQKMSDADFAKEVRKAKGY